MIGMILQERKSTTSETTISVANVKIMNMNLKFTPLSFEGDILLGIRRCSLDPVADLTPTKTNAASPNMHTAECFAASVRSDISLPSPLPPGGYPLVFNG